MGEFRSYCALVAKGWWATFVGIVLACVGGYNDVNNTTLLFPSYVWWIAAMVALFVGQFMAFHNLFGRLSALQKPQPDMTLSAVVARIIGSNDFWAEGNPRKVADAFMTIREKANLGFIDVWGRIGATVGNERFTPLSHIDKQFWAYMHIDYLDFLRDEKGRTERSQAHVTLSDKIYDLWFCAAQIDAAWPEESTWRWRLPFERKA